MPLYKWEISLSRAPLLMVFFNPHFQPPIHTCTCWHAGECYPIQVFLTAPPAVQSHWEQLSWTATAGPQPVGSAVVRVFLGKNGGLPQ